MRTWALGLLVCAACGGSKDANDAQVLLPGCETPIAGPRISVRKVGTVDDAALLVTSPPLDPRRFVIERAGAIRVYDNDVLLVRPFLDVRDQIAAGGEQGLLGLAFHPQYATNRQFFIFYTTNTANVIARCTASTADRNVADPTCTQILSIPDFAGNHNGGMMEFGKDGFLYIGTGDGGGGGDPQRTAQDPNRLLGKFLRLDVDQRVGGMEYGIPSTNPFATGGGAPEVFLLGVRNPWRWSFDKLTGDLWIGDVGQGRIEELTVLRAGDQVGKNLGWSRYEGSTCCDTASDSCSQSGTQYPCDPTGITMPQDERTHADGWISIIAGEVYRGTCYPDLAGWFFYTDYASADAGLQKARLKSDNSLEIVDTGVALPNGVTSIHADSRGELFITTENPPDLYHIEAGP